MFRRTQFLPSDVLLKFGWYQTKNLRVSIHDKRILKELKKDEDSFFTPVTQNSLINYCSLSEKYDS